MFKVMILYQKMDNLYYLRKKKVRGAISFFLRRDKETPEDSAEEKIADVSKNAKEALLNRELGDQLYQAMDRLPFRQKSAFALRYLEGMSLEEIGQSMELSAGAVKAHLWQAARKMKEALTPYLQAEG